MRKELRSIELLSPAKDLICGREAINHGADAVYIGAPKFGKSKSLHWPHPHAALHEHTTHLS